MLAVNIQIEGWKFNVAADGGGQPNVGCQLHGATSSQDESLRRGVQSRDFEE